MFARILAVASLAALVVAGPTPLAARDSQCSTGPVQCCNSVQQASQVQSLLSEFGFADILAGVTGQIAAGCTPITVIGAGGNSCTSQAVCCSGDKFNGVINVGCTPVSLGL